jgi:hypothetical protein
LGVHGELVGELVAGRRDQEAVVDGVVKRLPDVGVPHLAVRLLDSHQALQ